MNGASRRVYENDFRGVLGEPKAAGLNTLLLVDFSNGSSGEL